MILQTDLIPHENFHKGIWLSNEQVPWYFFVKKDRSFNIPKNKDFYSSLDDYLKPIVYTLHKHNIPTTPSCTGHFENKTYYSDIYDLLKDFKKSVKKTVILHDDENDVNYKYKNSNYKLPWEKEFFLDKICDYQKKGVLGFSDKSKKIYNSLQEDGFKKKHDDGITLILVTSKNEKDCYDKWNSVNQKLNNIIKKSRL